MNHFELGIDAAEAEYSDTIANYDAQAIRRLLNNGEPLSKIAPAFGYTDTQQAIELLDHHEMNLGVAKWPM